MASLTEGSQYYEQVHQTDTSYQHGHESDDQSKISPLVDVTSHKPCEWSIGWKTPSIIIGSYIAAINVAVAHYVYYRHLDRQAVESTIRQSWNNGISVAFVRIFSMTLATSASSAFTQLLWWFLRRRPIALKKIDAIFSLNTSPLNLYQVGLLRTLPTLWVFGLLFPLISITTIFPPGALVVQQLWTYNSSLMMVPTLDVNFRGNNTPIEFFENAFHMDDPDGNYQAPKVRYVRTGRRTLLNGAYLTRSSPCGLNCTYALTFLGPSFRCEDASPNPGDERQMISDFEKLPQSEGLGADFTYPGEFMAGSYKSNNTFLGTSSDDLFVFSVSFMDQEMNGLRNVSCISMNATYHANVTYTNGIQTVTVSMTDEEPLNATAISYDALFYDINESKPPTDPIHYAPSDNMDRPWYIGSDAELDYVYQGRQMQTLIETIVHPLEGAISGFGNREGGTFVGATLARETPFANPVYNASAMDYSGLYFTLSPSILEELIRNLTISTLNEADNNDTVKVTSYIYKNSYVFQEPVRLIAAYTAALGGLLPFVVVGFAAMVHNGVSASHGGFFQILCTTAHGSTIKQLARRACLGGEQSLPKELQELKVRFGEVRSGDGARSAAFGTVEETAPLEKGARYGGI